MFRCAYPVLILAAALTACTPTPPAPVAPRSSTTVQASQAKTWDAVVDVFAERNIPIKNMDRSSGFIATDPLGASGAKMEWVDCGKDVLGTPGAPTLATYTVLVRGDSTSSTVKATVRWTEPGTMNTVTECSTKGVWEASLESDVKQRAEAAKLHAST